MTSIAALARADTSGRMPPLHRHGAPLDAILAGLEAPLAQIDDSFVAVGNELVGCAARLAEVSRHFEDLPRDLESAEIHDATGRLGDVIRHAREIVAGFETEQCDLDGLVDRVDTAKAPMLALRKTIRMIGIVALNARVVAAGVSSATDELGVFTNDVAELSRKATGTIERFFQAYEKLASDLHKAAAERDRFQTAQQAAIEEAASRLSASLDDLTECRRRAAGSSVATSRLTRDIGARLGRTVMDMQVGDSTRQRIEHVAAALGDVRSLALGNAPPGLALDAPPEPGDIAALLDLLGWQIDAALDDFAAGIVDAGKSMSALTADVHALMSQSRDLYERRDRRGESAIGRLSAELHVVAGMLEACESDRRKLDAVALAVGDMVAQLLGHVEAVQQIEGSMRLVTLNAAVTCAKLGPRGKALDVIAKQLRELTGAMVTSAEIALAALSQAAERARTVVASADGIASGNISRLIADAGAAIVLFESVDQRLSAALQLLHEQECDCHRSVAHAVARFDGHAAVNASLTELSGQIASLARDLAAAPQPHLAPGATRASLYAHLYGYYSMESERRVHAQAVGAPPAAAPKDEASTAGEDDLGLF